MYKYYYKLWRGCNYDNDGQISTLYDNHYYF